jgi:tetratricopeptide (TPR) repeat protein
MEPQADEAVQMASRLAPSSAKLYQEVSRLMLRSALSAALGRELNVPGAKIVPAVDEIEPAELLQAELREHENAVAAHPDFADFRYKYGLLLRSAGRIEESLEQFRAAVRINPTYVRAMVKLGLSAWEAGRLEEATDALSKAVNLQPQYVDLHYRLGLVYADRGLWPMAVEQYRKALSRKPSAEAIEASLALALENMGLGGEDELPLAAAPSCSAPSGETDGEPERA